jgi:hypothetical protein
LLVSGDVPDRLTLNWRPILTAIAMPAFTFVLSSIALFASCVAWNSRGEGWQSPG